MKKTIVFPHIRRIFSAGLLGLSLLGLWLANLQGLSLASRRIRGNADVLGTTQLARAGANAGENTEAFDLEQRYNRLKKVVEKHPDYRDGFIGLAALGYQLSKNEEADGFLKQGKKLDPNHPLIARLSDLLEKKRL